MNTPTTSHRIPSHIAAPLLLALAGLPLSAFAQGLPTMEDPSRGQGSGILQTLQNYGYDIVLLIALFVVALLLGFGWWSAPRSLTIHVPPDLRSGSTRKWWDVPPESVYAFSFYVWQQVQRWPTNGEEDYPRNLRALSAYLTPSCRAFLQQDYEYRRASGELRQRVRGIYEIPGRGYGDDPATRVKVVSDRDWIVTLDVSADEYYGSEQVKRALVRYPIKVVRLDIDPERNPFGLALDCYASAPQRIEMPPTPTQAGAPANASGHLQGDSP